MVRIYEVLGIRYLNHSVKSIPSILSSAIINWLKNNEYVYQEK